ncbi:MAG: amidohydrolase family protein [Gammaproteobacteria bacterium]|nr:amidohydrolase family protein [Gammaproteobacteria bacterium]
MPTSHDPDGRRLPIKLDTTTNGEFVPIPLEPVHHHAREIASNAASENARRRNVSRRSFLVSACGAASTLLAMNAAYAAAGRAGGFFQIAQAAAVDPEIAAATLAGREFIFDVQGHFVNPQGAWLKRLPADARPLSDFPKTECRLADAPGERSYLQCLGEDEFIKDIFLDSDTDMMVLSFVPSYRDAEPLTIEEAAVTAGIVERMEGSHRLLVHGRVNPNQDGDMQGMDELAARWEVSAWKTYTQWGPNGKGFFLNDDVGLAFIEKARKLGVRNICVHKGIPFGPESYEHSLCNDIGVVASKYPDVNFLIYHSGFVPGQPEGPYDPARNEGIDSLIKTVLENDVAGNGNVYAELGSTWRYLMRDPDSAAHGLGKLFKYMGEDNVLWGTDSIWYGSPQDQIQAFRTFQISEELREAHGYPEITPELRAKVFGRNAMKPYQISIDEVKQRAGRDRIAEERLTYLETPDPHFRTHGPKTRREFMSLLAWNGGQRA